MSLIPLRSFSDHLPVIFVEARWQGNPSMILTQFGLSIDTDECNVAVFTRTSGVLLVAGVGSYMVYRMFVRFLGQNFMWTLVNQTRVDTLNRSDIRLLHPANVLRTSECCSSMFADDEYSSGETGSVVSACTKNTFISTEYSRSRRRYLSSRSARNRSHPTPLRKRDERKAMKGELVDENCQKKEFTPTHHVYCRSFSARSESEASRGLSQISITPSEKSASLRLIWDDPQWDSEVDLNGQDILRKGQSPSPSNISEMSEFVAAQDVFDETTLSKLKDEIDRTEVFVDSESMKDDTTSESMQQAHELIERSCLVDSHHLYQITAGCLASSDAVSVCSEQSSRSFLGLRQRAAANQASTGLLELTRCVSNVQGGGCLEAGMGTSMTDSAISKDTATTSSVARTTNRSIMFDSAIGTDLVSSEDESCNAAISSSSLHHCSIAHIPSTSNPSIIRRTNLKLISEDQHSDQSISERSLEWFEDEFGDDDGEAFAESFAEFGIKSLGDGQGIAFDLDNAVRLNTSQAADCTPQTKAKAITSLDIPGCASSTNSPKLDIENSSECSTSTSKLRRHLHGTRDLMVWAREKFSTDSPQLKVLQTLYSSRRRLKRIGIRRSSDTSTHLLASVLHSAVYHQLAIFPCSSFDIVKEAIRGAFARYDFLKQWSSPSSRIIGNLFTPTVTTAASSSSSYGLGNAELTNESLAVEAMRSLWDMQHHSKDGSSRGDADCDLRNEANMRRCVEALRLMLILRAVDVFESLDEFHSLPKPFYRTLFAKHNPRQIMDRLNEGAFHKDELCLLADTLRIRMEVIDCTKMSRNTAGSPSPVSVYPDAEGSSPMLPFVKTSDGCLYPVYYVAD